MSLAKRILDEANEDITTTELYKVVQENLPSLIEDLKVLSKDFQNAHSDTEVEHTSNLDSALKSISSICDVLDKSGFTYFPQPTDFRRNIIGRILDNFIDFYETYLDGFMEEDIEILNTNSKDLLSILENLNKATL